MLGLTHNSLKKYVGHKLGPTGWDRVVAAAGLPRKAYLTHELYPDEEMVALFQATAQLANLTFPQLMEDFGEAVMPEFFKLAGGLILPEWKTLDMLEHVESLVHVPIRAQYSASKPPLIELKRVSPTRAVMTYRSPLKLCGWVRGGVRGVARHCSQKVEVTDVRCMSRGDPDCEITIDLVE